jgi:hypothetical protein
MLLLQIIVIYFKSIFCRMASSELQIKLENKIKLEGKTILNIFYILCLQLLFVVLTMPFGEILIISITLYLICTKPYSLNVIWVFLEEELYSYTKPHSLIIKSHVFFFKLCCDGNKISSC